MVHDAAFFLPIDDDGTTLRAQPTQHAVGPWDPGSLHAGPPSALVAAALRRHHPTEDRRVVRVTVEILRPIPADVLAVRTSVVRPGRRVDLLAAEVSDTAGRAVLHARVWRLRVRTPAIDLPVVTGGLPHPDTLAARTGFFRPVGWQGYLEAMETRFVRGSWADPGPATAWFRMRHPLLADEDPDPVERVLIAADSGNGISHRAGPGTPLGPEGVFINVDLSVHLLRPPTGEWVGLEADTMLDPAGLGLASSVLHDPHGPIGRAAQSLMVEPTP